jgi:hypothetical protein
MKQTDNKGQDMKDKIVKEDENFTYFQTEYGIGYVASKHAYFSLQPERSKREDSECDFCKGDCKCLLKQKNHLFITESIKNEEIVHKGPITFIV